VGHPRGLACLSFCEAWERFSFYGTQTLPVLYTVGQLLLPGHLEHIVGFMGGATVAMLVAWRLFAQLLAPTGPKLERVPA
jgi:POT family proton-dependent oligopeptide transporter